MSTVVLPRAELPLDVLVPAGTEEETKKPRGILPAQKRNSRFISIERAVGSPFDALPASFLFGALRHPALKLLKPIPLRTERSSEGISVVWDEVEEFGFGDTFSSAIDDFSHTLAELYFDLTSSERVLGSDLLAVRDKVGQYIGVLKEQ